MIVEGTLHLCQFLLVQVPLVGDIWHHILQLVLSSLKV